jgi:hypothetical protein
VSDRFTVGDRFDVLDGGRSIRQSLAEGTGRRRRR